MDRKIVLLSTGIVAALLLNLVVTPALAKKKENVFSAWSTVTPIIDGRIGPREWVDADHQNFMLTWNGENHPAVLYVKNDRDNLYLALKIFAEDIDENDIVDFYFDSNNNGVIDLGDDIISAGFPVVQPWAPPPGTWSFDMFCCKGLSTNLLVTYDTLDPRGGEFIGTFDLQAAFTHTQMTAEGINYGEVGIYVFEFSHPLNSGDVLHDIALEPGDSLSFKMYYLDNIEAAAYYPGPTSSNFATLVVASP